MIILGGADQLQEYENLSSIPKKNTLVAPPSILNFKLLQKLIQARYENNFLFPVKAEMLLFLKLITGGPRGDLQSVNFSLKFLEILKSFVDMFVFKLKFMLCKSPRGPPVIRFEKSNISAFTGKN